MPFVIVEAQKPDFALLLDDFRSRTPVDGLRWEGFTETVMGGASEMSSTIVTDDGVPRLRMRGNVSLANNGGFYLFARTRQTRFPWKYYTAPVPVSGEWRTVDVPWSAFEPGKYGRTGEFRPDQLLSIALTAAFKEFSPLL